MTEDKEGIKALLWLAWGPSYHSNSVCGWCLLSEKSFMLNMNSIPLTDLIQKSLLRYHCECHGNIVAIATGYFANVYYPKEALYQI